MARRRKNTAAEARGECAPPAPERSRTPEPRPIPGLMPSGTFASRITSSRKRRRSY